MLRFYTSPYKLKESWKELYSSSAVCTPFQSYEANEGYYKVYNFKGARRKYRPIFAYHTNGEKKCIIPLLVHKKEKLLRNFSSFGSMDYYNVIASDYDAVYIRVLKDIMEYFLDYKVIFENIIDNSMLHEILLDCNQEKEICVHIALDKFASFDEYYKALSKHQRQNIRTAYNKTLRDYKEIRLEVYSRTNPMPREIRYQCTKMYDERYAYKFFRSKNRLSIFARTIIHKLQDSLNNIIESAEHNQTFVLYYNHFPVAFMSGFFDRRKSIFYVPRLTCAINYLSYDPGIILVFETIKALKKDEVACLDLTRGDEPYKYAMGGEEHYNYAIIDTTNNILNTL